MSPSRLVAEDLLLFLTAKEEFIWDGEVDYLGTVILRKPNTLRG